MRMLLGGLLIIGAVIVAALLAVWMLQRNLIYHPDPERIAPAAIGLKGVEEVVHSFPTRRSSDLYQIHVCDTDRKSVV